MQTGYTEMLHGKTAFWRGLARFGVPQAVTEVVGLGLIVVQSKIKVQLFWTSSLEETLLLQKTAHLSFLWLRMTFIPSVQILPSKEDFNLPGYTSGTI